ncbi:hypothetical protein [Leuconostoc citreum]|uniref:hypothetical protein n=1 Tax=Leuconostoc citreum TaxID=33964 RepID=UPI0032DE5B94
MKASTYYSWRHWQPNRQEKRREAIKPYILDVYLKAYQTLTEVQAAIGWYINFYNRNHISNVA